MSLPVTAIPTASVKKEVETVFFVVFQGRSLGGGFNLPNHLHQEVKHQSFSTPKVWGFMIQFDLSICFKGG